MTAAAQLPINLKANPRLSSWLRFDAKGFVELSPGKIEIGQGIITALAQIAADELDIGLDRIRMIPTSTAMSPNEGTTSGSLSVEQSGSAVRQAAAQARAIYLGAAAQRLGVAADSLAIEDGTIVGPGNLRTSYWELADDALLARDATSGVAAKAPNARRIAGTPAQRLDLPDKVFGRPRFVHDLALPGLVHGRVMKPPGPGATLAALDEAGARAVAGVTAIVRDGSFAGVVAETEAAAEAALAALRKGATWTGGDALPGRIRSCRVAQEPACRDHDRGRAQAGCPCRYGAHNPAAIFAALHRPRLDGALVRDRAVDRPGQRADLVALPGRLQSAGGHRACPGHVARGDRREPCRGRRLLRPQRRRRRGLRRGAAGSRRAGSPGTCAMVARGRACLGADGRRHGHRDRGRPRRGRRHRPLARRRVEQRPRVAARTAADPDAARRLAARQAVRAPDRL